MNEVLKLDSQVCFPVYTLSREIVNHYRPYLEQIGITYPQYLVMMILWEMEPQAVHQIGKQLDLDSGTLTPLLKRLESKGFILRKRKSCDERVVEITLTDAGRDLKEQAILVPRKVIDSMGVTAEELSQLKEIVLKILHRTK